MRLSSIDLPFDEYIHTHARTLTETTTASHTVDEDILYPLCNFLEGT